MLTRKIQDNTMLFYKGEDLVFSIDEPETEGEFLMILKGDLISEAAHHIEDEICAYVSVGLKVILDFKEVTFVAPSILDSLLNSQQLRDSFRHGEIILKNVPSAVYQAMDDTGITELLMIED